MIKDYDTWSFRSRTFGTAILLSLIWHFFWFFSVTIVISAPKHRQNAKPKIVSLGPVLDDSIFRTLVETRPQLSETFYRGLSDLSSAVEPEVRTMERHSPGDVVSVSFGKRFLDSMRVLVGGDKTSPDYEFISRLKIAYGDDIPGLEGDAKDRQIVSRPEEPDMPPALDLALKSAKVEIAFTVDTSGAVVRADIAHSSGSPSVDDRWLRYLKRWHFSPLEAKFGNQDGRITFDLGAPKADEEPAAP